MLCTYATYQFLRVRARLHVLFVYLRCVFRVVSHTYKVHLSILYVHSGNRSGPIGSIFNGARMSRVSINMNNLRATDDVRFSFQFCQIEFECEKVLYIEKRECMLPCYIITSR